MTDEIYEEMRLRIEELERQVGSFDSLESANRRIDAALDANRCLSQRIEELERALRELLRAEVATLNDTSVASRAAREQARAVLEKDK